MQLGSQGSEGAWLGQLLSCGSGKAPRMYLGRLGRCLGEIALAEAEGEWPPLSCP